MILVNNRTSRQLQAALLLVLFIAAWFAVAMVPADAQRRGRGLPLIRDAEIEGLLKDYTTPIFRAGGLQKGAIDIFILNRRDFNAFVTGSKMFINTGALIRSKTPNEIIGVISHETGHLISGHLALLRDRLDKAQLMAALGALAGAGASVFGGQGGAAAGRAIAQGSRQAIQRSILAYRRADEIAADRVGINLLNKTKQSSLGMVETFKTLGKNTLFSTKGQDPYARSHPLPQERIALIQDLANKSPYARKKDPKSLQLRHDMMRAKIIAYTDGGAGVRAMFKRNLNGTPARYGDAIATFLAGAPGRAVPKINKLIREQPKNAYLYEMKGEMLLSAGRPGQAIAPLKKAIALDKYKSSLIRIQLGHAYLQSGDPSLLDDAVRELKNGISRDRNSANGYSYLARAYARQGKQNLAMAATAEERFLQGRFKEAKRFAFRAQSKLKRGTPQWVRLQDILDYKIPKRRRRR